MLKNRRSRLIPFFEENGLDAILCTDMNNIRYLSGFTGSEAALLLARERSWFLCDSRYTEQAREEVVCDEVVECGAARLDAIADITRVQNLCRLGFEASHLTVAIYRRMVEKLPGITLVELGSELDGIRTAKDSAEIEQLAAVAVLSSHAFRAITHLITPGVMELDIAMALELEMRRRGADGKAFDFIVASGERGAMPHGRASEKLIQAGDMITIDFGASKNGYHSDETVTVACGEPGERAREIYAIVKEAHDRAIAAVKPGISCRELDLVARSYIGESGYGDYFGHGLGHGVGLEIHEQPTLSPRSSAPLLEGSVITIEPGIYLPGFGGVRIEDTVVVTADGCRLLTQVAKKLHVL